MAYKGGDTLSCRGLILPLFLGVSVLTGACTSSDSTQNLYGYEIEYLSEDVLDLVTIYFQAGENAYVGDPVDPADVVEAAGPGNNYRVTYDLPYADRPGLGEGSGRAWLRVIEDGVVNRDPLSFSIQTTTADEVVIEYDLEYDGLTYYRRTTDVNLLVDVVATRVAPGPRPFDVEYWVEGWCNLGTTFCEVATEFAAPGAPQTGIVPGVGGGSGIIDDPDVFDIFYMDLIWEYTDRFRARGDVACCAQFNEGFYYLDVFGW
jgi:hypothetical protein